MTNKVRKKRRTRISKNSNGSLSSSFSFHKNSLNLLVIVIPVCRFLKEATDSRRSRSDILYLRLSFEAITSVNFSIRRVLLSPAHIKS